MRSLEEREAEREQREHELRLAYKQKEVFYSGYKIIKSGHVIEVYKYQRKPRGQKVEDENGSESENEQEKGLRPDRTEENRKQSLYRTRQTVRRQALANFSEQSMFITFTFAENVKDLDFAHDEFKKFMKRLRYKMGCKIKFLAVVEFQKRGAIHYHSLMDLKSEELKIVWDDSESVKSAERWLAGIWGNGFMDIKDVRHVDNVGAYLVKYMVKELEDERLIGRKHYLSSKGLIKPEEVPDENIEAWLDTLETYFPTYSSKYTNDWTGEVQFLEYNLKRK